MVMYCDICGAKIEDGEKINECPECLCPFENVDKNSSIKEFKSRIPNGNVVKRISPDESFMNAMIELYEKDPIEYQLKIQQFKTQLQQQEIAQQVEKESNIPHCPHCHSTNIKSISGLNRGASIAMWGIFSKKINKSFECKNCGYTW